MTWLLLGMGEILVREYHVVRSFYKAGLYWVGGSGLAKFVY